MLHSFHLSIAIFRVEVIHWLVSQIKPLRELLRREYDSSLREVTYTYPLREFGRHLATKLRLRHFVQRGRGIFSVDRVCRGIDRRVARFVAERSAEYDAIYCYEDCAEQSFRVAKAGGRRCIYELPSIYWRTIHNLLKDEREREPEWAMTLSSFHDSLQKLSTKDREIALADCIYVASSFAKASLELYPGTLPSIVVIPYGFPAVNDSREWERVEGRKVRALFVGGLTQHKGISYLFESVRGLEDCLELTVVGRGDLDGCEALREALRGVHYIPTLPHSEVLELMSRSDLFIFPSLHEGFGLVVTESMSQGTPVITTERTCGADLITHGVDGWLVEAGSASSLRSMLDHILAHPADLERVGRAARARATQRPWSLYEEELTQSLNRYLN